MFTNILHIAESVCREKVFVPSSKLYISQKRQDILLDEPWKTAIAELGGYGIVRILGTQDSEDTLLDDSGSHFIYQYYIQGSLYFIFGTSRSLYQECVIQSTAKSKLAIAADHKNSPNENTWFSFVNYSITETCSIFLGRGMWYFGEYQCTDRGADMRARVPRSKSFSYEEARPFLHKKFIGGEQWLRL
ncbi:Pectinesterase QRT1 [Morella rubra]|uniref:pectinesterase n=1 Tax=Morella rubra TaxID=262757 RepID=A0A6A1W711_9ROSI|nr:Pectinesterase QRT1 [Morella rubra]